MSVECRFGHSHSRLLTARPGLAHAQPRLDLIARVSRRPWNLRRRTKHLGSRDLAAVIANSYFEPPPWNAVLGPIVPRGGPNGFVTRYGCLVVRWGDTRQVDMTFSIAKSYLSILAGIAYDRGLIPDVDEPVNRRVVDDAFAAPQNRAITWSHLLQQTSEWEGTLWGKPDMVDRNRDLSTEGGPLAKKGLPRPLQAPGTHWEYNDVRVTLLSLALLRLFRRPLPDVFSISTVELRYPSQRQ